MVVVLPRPRPEAKLASATKGRRRKSGQEAQAFDQAFAYYRFVPNGPRGPCGCLKQKRSAAMLTQRAPK